MKHIYRTVFVASIALFCGLSSIQAQNLQAVPVNITNDLNPPEPIYRNVSGFNKGSSCGVDTVYYNYSKTTQFQRLDMNKGAQVDLFIQYYDAPQAVTVRGFDFFAWQSSGTNAVVTLTASLYRAGTDSLPTGPVIRTVTVNIDSTFGNGQLSALRKSAIFGAPATVSDPYVLTLETSSSTTVSIISNDFNAGNGKKEWLSAVRIQNVVYRSHQISVGGIPFDADFIFMPHVEYQLDADFTVPGCQSVGNPITFTNQSSPINLSKFYNAAATVPQLSFRWDFGDTSVTVLAVDGQHIYNKSIVYPVTLKDTIYGWRVGCVDQIVKMVYPAPPSPVVSNDGPKCAGETIHLFSDSFPGGQYTWTGPNGFTSMDRNPIISSTDVSMSGNYSVEVSANGCTSVASVTSVTINPFPDKPVSSNDGPKCEGDTVTFTATSPSPQIQYEWIGPGSFVNSNSSFSINGVDISMKGEYYVRVMNAHCTTEYDTTILQVFPPPATPVLSATDSTLCIGDDLELLVDADAGVNYHWRGPNGFSSTIGNPVINDVGFTHAGLYIVYVSIGNCVSTEDTLDVTVSAVPSKRAIAGFDTTTEFLEKVYIINSDTNSQYNWTVQGGTIENGAGKNKITVKWGAFGAGSVKVTEVNIQGCSGPEHILNVTIKKMPGTYIQLAEILGLNIFPNPTTGNLTVEFTDQSTSNMEIRVTDMSGRIIKDQGEGITFDTDKISVDLTDVLPGVYFLELNVDELKQYVKIVRQ